MVILYLWSYGHMGYGHIILMVIWAELFSDTPIRRGRRILWVKSQSYGALWEVLATPMIDYESPRAGCAFPDTSMESFGFKYK